MHNTFSGPVTINGGLLLIDADTNLGTVPAGNTPNMIVFNGGELRSTARPSRCSPPAAGTWGRKAACSPMAAATRLQLSSYLVQGPGQMTFADINGCAMNLQFAASGAAMTYSGATTFLLGKSARRAVPLSSSSPTPTSFPRPRP